MYRAWMRVAVIALAGLGIVASAHASSITAGTYDLNDVTVDGFNLTGTLTLDASGIVTAADIALQDAALGNPVFTHVDSAGGPSGYNPVADYAYISDSGIGQVALYYLTSLDAAGNVDLCILSANDCNAYQASYIQIYKQSSFGYNPVDLNSGALAAVSSPAPTPEPGSLALLGTGVLGVAAVTRRKFRRV
jgi:PEP-CTERM motif